MQVIKESLEQEMIIASILYLMSETGKKIPLTTELLLDDEATQEEKVDLSFLEDVMKDLFSKELVEISGTEYVITEKGRERLLTLVEMWDHALQFEIFGGVLLTRELKDDECSDDPFFPLDHIYDPRFLGPDEVNEEAEDLRIAMISFIMEQAEEEEVENFDPRRLVFLQKLIDGEFRSKSFFFDLLLGKFFKEVNDIVESQYKWQDIAETEEEATEVMKNLYEAGMLEQRKRDGNECSECGIPLGVFEFLKLRDGEELNQCPNPDCLADYRPQEITVMETETIPEHVEVFEEPIWTEEYYDYEPYGYYDPYNPFDDMAFLCLCSVLW